MVVFRSLGVAVATWFVIGSAWQTENVERCNISDDNKCPVEKLQLLPGSNGSALIYPGGKTRCAFDSFDGGNVSALPAKKDYFFQVFPEPSNKDKVLFFFQGGGACVDDASCSFAASCTLGKSNLFQTIAIPANNSGIFDKTQPENPFKDWNIVHVSYCTGDVHMGNVVRDLPPPSNVSLLRSVDPVCQAKNPINQVGYINTMAVLDWTIANYPAPKQVVIGGLSAGSLAVQAYAKLIAEKWKAKENKIEVSVLPDSFVGVAPNPDDAVKLLQYYGACENDFSLPSDIVARCRNASLALPELVGSVISALPDSKWLYINSKADKVQRMYYELLKLGLNGFPFTSMPTPDAFYQEMQTILNGYKQISSLVRSVLIEGDTHGFVARSLLFNTTDDTNTSLPGIIKDWLKSSNSNNGKGSLAPVPSSADHPAC